MKLSSNCKRRLDRLSDNARCEKNSRVHALRRGYFEQLGALENTDLDCLGLNRESQDKRQHPMTPTTKSGLIIQCTGSVFADLHKLVVEKEVDKLAPPVHMAMESLKGSYLYKELNVSSSSDVRKREPETSCDDNTPPSSHPVPLSNKTTNIHSESKCLLFLHVCVDLE